MDLYSSDGGSGGVVGYDGDGNASHYARRCAFGGEYAGSSAEPRVECFDTTTSTWQWRSAYYIPFNMYVYVCMCLCAFASVIIALFCVFANCECFCEGSRA